MNLLCAKVYDSARPTNRPDLLLMPWLSAFSLSFTQINVIWRTLFLLFCFMALKCWFSLVARFPAINYHFSFASSAFVTIHRKHKKSLGVGMLLTKQLGPCWSPLQYAWHQPERNRGGNVLITSRVFQFTTYVGRVVMDTLIGGNMVPQTSI